MPGRLYDARRSGASYPIGGLSEPGERSDSSTETWDEASLSADALWLSRLREKYRPYDRETEYFHVYMRSWHDISPGNLVRIIAAFVAAQEARFSRQMPLVDLSPRDIIVRWGAGNQFVSYREYIAARDYLSRSSPQEWEPLKKHTVRFLSPIFEAYDFVLRLPNGENILTLGIELYRLKSTCELLETIAGPLLLQEHVREENERARLHLWSYADRVAVIVSHKGFLPQLHGTLVRQDRELGDALAAAERAREAVLNLAISGADLEGLERARRELTVLSQTLNEFVDW